MTVFGDADPEDSWDPDDPVTELLDNLRRRILAVLAGHLADRDRQRFDLVQRDLAHIAERVRNGRIGSTHG